MLYFFHWKYIYSENLNYFISVDNPFISLTSWAPGALIPNHPLPTRHFHLLLASMSDHWTFPCMSCCHCHFRLTVWNLQLITTCLPWPPDFPASAAATDSANSSFWNVLCFSSSVPLLYRGHHSWIPSVILHQTLQHLTSTYISESHFSPLVPPSHPSHSRPQPSWTFTTSSLTTTLSGDLSFLLTSAWDWVWLLELHNQVQIGSPTSNSCNAKVPCMGSCAVSSESQVTSSLPLRQHISLVGSSVWQKFFSTFWSWATLRCKREKSKSFSINQLPDN